MSPPKLPPISSVQFVSGANDVTKNKTSLSFKSVRTVDAKALPKVPAKTSSDFIRKNPKAVSKFRLPSLDTNNQRYSRTYTKQAKSVLPQAVVDKAHYFNELAHDVKGVLDQSSMYDISNLRANIKKTAGRDVSSVHKNLSLVDSDDKSNKANLKDTLNDIANQVCFTHETNEKNFKAIMKGGGFKLYSQTQLASKLGPSSDVFKGLNDSVKGGGNFVYTRLVTEESAQKMNTDHLVGGRGKYMFLFKGDLVKTRASYANPVDGKGLIPIPQTTEGAKKSIAHNILAYQICIKKHSCNNEVGFHGEIPFDMLSNIVVKADKNENVQQMKSLTIEYLEPERELLKNITGKELEDLVVVKSDDDRRNTLLNLTKV